MVSQAGMLFTGLAVVFLFFSPFIVGMFFHSVHQRFRPGKAVSFFGKALVFFAWWVFPLIGWMTGGMELTLVAFAASFAACFYAALMLRLGFIFRPVEWWQARGKKDWS